MHNRRHGSTDSRLPRRGRRDSRCISEASCFDDVDGKVILILASGSPTRCAMRASSDDAARDSHAGGGPRHSAPSINFLASWVFLCLYLAHQANPFSDCVLMKVILEFRKKNVHLGAGVLVLSVYLVSIFTSCNLKWWTFLTTKSASIRVSRAHPGFFCLYEHGNAPLALSSSIWMSKNSGLGRG